GPDEVRAAVAQAGDVDLVVLLDGEDGGGAHAAAGALVGAGGDNCLVSLVEGGLHGAVGGLAGGEAVVQDAGGDPRSHAAGLLAGALTAQAVGDEEHLTLGVGDEPIFVLGAQALGAAAADANDELRHETPFRLAAGGPAIPFAGPRAARTGPDQI